MEALTWTGSLAGLNIIFGLVLAVLGVAIVVQIVSSFFGGADARAVGADGTLATNSGFTGFINMIVSYAFYAVLVLSDERKQRGSCSPALIFEVVDLRK